MAVGLPERAGVVPGADFFLLGESSILALLLGPALGLQIKNPVISQWMSSYQIYYRVVPSLLFVGISDPVLEVRQPRVLLLRRVGPTEGDGGVDDVQVGLLVDEQPVTYLVPVLAPVQCRL